MNMGSTEFVLYVLNDMAIFPESGLVVFSLSLFFLPEDSDVELSAPSLAPCLPAYHDASHHVDNGLNL